MKPENTFIRSVHKHIPEVYAEKMCNPYRSGTADVWYSGTKGDMWVEYKWIKALPQRADILPDLSPQQLRWVNNRRTEGRTVFVVVGCPAGGVIFYNWGRAMPADAFRAALLNRRDLAQWILTQVGASPCLLQAVSSTQQKSSPRRTGS